jgi:hypothetical protein
LLRIDAITMDGHECGEDGAMWVLVHGLFDLGLFPHRILEFA